MEPSLRGFRYAACRCCHSSLHRQRLTPVATAATMGDEEVDTSNNMEALKRTMQYALIKNCDMNEEMRSDCVDAVISATEK